MKYYFVKHENDMMVTGSIFPQVQKVVPNQKYSDKQSIYELSRSLSKFPDNSINVDYLVLAKGAKLTDILSCSMLVLSGFLITEKVKRILSTILIMPHKYFEFIIQDHEGVSHKYYWLHILDKYEAFTYEESKYEYVDFRKTKFKIYKSSQDIGGVEVNSIKELKEKQSNLAKGERIWASEIELHKEFSTLNLSLFKLYLTRTTWYITEELKSKFDLNNVTGLRYLEANNLIVQ